MRSIFVSIIVCLISINAFAATKRTLFFSPHPDDEGVGLSTEIWRATHSSAKEKIEYQIVVMTCGDAYIEAMDLWTKSGKAKDLNNDGKIDYVDLGFARHQETLDALKVLGVPPEKVIFLGYPDGGLKDMTHNPGIYESMRTHVKAVPYPFAFRPGAPYTNESVRADLKSVITSFNPDVVYTPTPTDMHPDHFETSELVSQTLAQLGRKPKHLEYINHWEGKEKGWPFPTLEWKQLDGHIPADIKISLASVGLTRDVKLEALRQYTTQRILDPVYFDGFAKNQELFWNARPKISDYLLSHENSVDHLMQNTVIGRDPKLLNKK
jgi:LmbE family N-acetylglucosaminyl deacetylase